MLAPPAAKCQMDDSDAGSWIVRSGLYETKSKRDVKFASGLCEVFVERHCTETKDVNGHRRRSVVNVKA